MKRQLFPLRHVPSGKNLQGTFSFWMPKARSWPYSQESPNLQIPFAKNLNVKSAIRYQCFFSSSLIFF